MTLSLASLLDTLADEHIEPTADALAVAFAQVFAQ